MKSVEINNPVVSVITPSYNSAQYISETINSVLAQTYPDWEMIIVDDCSKDQTVQIIKDFQRKDNRIKLIQLEKNQGAAVARNTAIRASQGRFLAFLDSDDQWMPEKLEKQRHFMESNEIAFSFTQYVTIDEAGNRIGLGDEIPERIKYNQLIKRNMIGCLTVMLDKEKIGEIEMVNIRTRQDYVLWLDLCKRGYIAYSMKEPLALYRRQEQSISSNKMAMAKQNWKVYRQIEQLSLMKSSWYFLHYIFYKLKKYGKK
ncbi:glycosyl transferase [Salipaludibacillus keqinensis]|uniref:Glycosyl transferase n=1 Tax=Salipaludibacillus keqinensis TaxID=2045207 RepID=A0A323TBA2_9BACI|nr:glycosyltransferase family 2 protein [Salipaludibacillus keqinensis]PYZ92541.1 glycosyl transferase [Salipaludibacillus keqinensis]